MKLTLVSDDTSLQKALDDTGFFQDVSIPVGGIGGVTETDILLVSDNLVNYNEFIFWADSRDAGKIKSVYYILSDVYEYNLNAVYATLKAKDIKYFPPLQTVTQITDRLIQTFAPGFNKQKNIVTFFGADSRVGTTMTAQGVAETIAKYSELRVCLVFLNGSLGTEYMKVKEIAGLDSIKVKLFNGILTAQQLKDTCIARDNLYILPGNNNVLDTRHYTPEHVEFLLDLAAEEFNVVIVDAGCYWDLYGMTVGALNTTRLKYLVTSQQKTAKNRFFRTSAQVLEPLKIIPKEFMVIVNKFIDTTAFISPDALANDYGMMLAGYLPYMDVMGFQAEEEEKSLAAFNDKDYSQRMLALCKQICTLMGLTLEDGKEERRGIMKVLGGLLRG